MGVVIRSMTYIVLNTHFGLTTRKRYYRAYYNPFLIQDTMVIIESTANGYDDFKEKWDKAVNGETFTLYS